MVVVLFFLVVEALVVACMALVEANLAVDGCSVGNFVLEPVELCVLVVVVTIVDVVVLEVVVVVFSALVELISAVGIH